LTVSSAPLASAPSMQVTVAVPEQLPAVVADDTNVARAGSGSVTVTAAAGLGPELWTWSV
jgi:hypothetical protein